MNAYNFARRLKTLSGLTPYDDIAKVWTSEPDRFTVNPIHQMPGLNTEQQLGRSALELGSQCLVLGMTLMTWSDPLPIFGRSA